jgi:hypothetical protein
MRGRFSVSGNAKEGNRRNDSLPGDAEICCTEADRMPVLQVGRDQHDQQGH